MEFQAQNGCGPPALAGGWPNVRPRDMPHKSGPIMAGCGLMSNHRLHPGSIIQSAVAPWKRIRRLERARSVFEEWGRMPGAGLHGGMDRLGGLAGSRQHGRRKWVRLAKDHRHRGGWAYGLQRYLRSHKCTVAFVSAETDGNLSELSWPPLRPAPAARFTARSQKSW
jgi:hypothetical protein